MKRNKDNRLQELRNKGVELYSISKLDCINNCLYEAFRTYKLHKRGKDNIYSVLGTKLHDVLEMIANYEATEDELLPTIQEELENVEMLGFEFIKDRNGGDSIKTGWISDMENFAKTFKFPEGNYETEQLFIYKTDEGKYLQGYIDLIDCNDDGTITIIDHKSSSMYTKEGIEEHSRQLLTYLLGKEQEGFNVKKIAWHFMKYAEIEFMGKKTVKSKEKTLLNKVIERKKIGSEMSKYVEQDLFEAGYDEIDSEIILDKFQKTNMFDCLPEEIRSKYTIKPHVLEYEITEEAKESCKKYIKDTIEKWESLGEDEKNYPPVSFTKIQKNGKEVDNTFYCHNLCGHSSECKYYQDYLAMKESQADDEYEDLF